MCSDKRYYKYFELLFSFFHFTHFLTFVEPNLLHPPPIMLFQSIATLAFLAVSVVGAPTKNTVEKRVDAPSAITAFNTLTSQFTSAGADLKTALSTVDMTDAVAITTAATPVLVAMSGHVQELKLDLALRKRGQLLEIRQSSTNYTEVAAAIAEALSAVITALGPLLDAIQAVPGLGALLGPLLSNLDVDLAIVLTGLGLVLSGVLKLVGDLLNGLLGSLSGLGFTNIIGALGL